MPTQETEIAATEWKARTGEALDRVLGGGRLVITRHGRPIAAVIGLQDLEALRELERLQTLRERSR